MKFKRDMTATLESRMAQFPVVALTGPRQSGKTTLLQTFKNTYTYINLESPEQLERIQADPKGTLQNYTGSGLMIDEAQKAPQLFSYIQVLSDEANRKGQYILSGSQNFLLNQQITQSLAGRSAILELLPLTYSEYLTHPALNELTLWAWLYGGAYPRPYQDTIPSKVWMDAYVRTYLERDVRDLLKVKELAIFQRFLRLCAGRHGQLLNMHQLAIDTGVSHTTVNHWLSVLEASYLIFRLQPYHNNFNKRLVKSPKLYFYDSGLLCYLLGIDSADHLSIHANRGAIFEGYVISELKKMVCNQGKSSSFYFWRDNNGNEMDCVIEHGGQLMALEIKSTTTLRSDLLKNLNKWQQLTGAEAKHGYLVYAGDQLDQLQGYSIIPWNGLKAILM